jgi:glycogen operon protein
VTDGRAVDILRARFAMSQPPPDHRDRAPGATAPLGAEVRPDGVNFCVYARRASRVELLLFDAPDAPAPARVVPLDRAPDRLHWHALVPGAAHGQVYGYRVHGPRNPAPSDRFDPDKLLLDPYARAVAGVGRYDRRAASAPGDNITCAMRAVVVDPSRYDWQDDRPLPAPAGPEIIYEMHVGAFTGSPSSGVPAERRGTFAGVVDKIPYLRDLGITTVELLPVQHFETQDAPVGLTNFWGYSPVAWFAPHAGYAAGTDPLAAVEEFRDLVKALHRAGLRVVLDVVYNHTAEGPLTGPLLSWRGFASTDYYLHDRDGVRLADFTGCGNSFNANHPVALRLILDSLRYWVREMHVDGFRFDLASSLTRDEQGEAQLRPPLLRLMETDPELAGTTLIAEPWDAAGLYQVGAFPGERFAQWNGPFRDDVRRFLRSDDAAAGAVMARLVGSPDIMDRDGAGWPGRSINFVTCHDGFTLADQVAYNRKHNEGNLEQNRDGSDQNLSWNGGAEGPTQAPLAREIRRRQVRNLASFLLLSHGTPMLLMGDEVLRTQQGNNNTWCQDNPLGWFDWDDVTRHGDMLRFVRGLIALRQSLSIFALDRYWRAAEDVLWHGVELGKPDLGFASHSVAWTLVAQEGQERVHVMVNAWWRPLTFAVPTTPANLRWHRVVDTSRETPDDLTMGAEAPRVTANRLTVPWHAVVILHAR